MLVLVMHNIMVEKKHILCLIYGYRWQITEMSMQWQLHKYMFITVIKRTESLFELCKSLFANSHHKIIPQSQIALVRIPIGNKVYYIPRKLHVSENKIDRLSNGNSSFANPIQVIQVLLAVRLIWRAKYIISEHSQLALPFL